MSPNSSVCFIIMIVNGSPVHYDSTVVHVLYSTRIGGPGDVSGWTVGGGGGGHLLWHTGVETRIERCRAILRLIKVHLYYWRCSSCGGHWWG